MPTLSETRPHKVLGLLAREVAKLQPHVGSNCEQFAERGEKWATPYLPDAEPVKLSAPDIMAGYYSFEDSQRMLDADMCRRRRMHQNLRIVVGAIKQSKIVRIP